MKTTEYLSKKVFLEYRRSDFICGVLFALVYTSLFHMSGYHFLCYVELKETSMSWSQLFLLFAAMVNVSFFFITFGRAALRGDSHT